MAPFGLKLWGNAFQMIPDISFFDVEKHFLQNLFVIILPKVAVDFFRIMNFFSTSEFTPKKFSTLN